MGTEEKSRFAGDYATLALLSTLQYWQEQEEEGIFASGMKMCWTMFVRELPEAVQKSKEFVVLSLYFQHKGVVADAVKQCLEHMQAHTSVEEHTCGMRYVASRLELNKKLFSFARTRAEK